jgi:predicted nuclease with TOPRIM domain
LFAPPPNPCRHAPILSLQWEGRIERNESQDAERDQQIATLQETVTQLTERLDTMTEMVELLRRQAIMDQERGE